MKNRLARLALSIGLSVAPMLSPTLVQAGENEHHEHGFSQEDQAAFLDAKIAAVKAGLKLSPAQEKNWPAVESAIRAYDKAKQDQMDAWQKAAHAEDQHKDLIEHMHRKAQFLSAYATETNKLADAVKPLYDSLDDAQRHRLGMLLHMSKRVHGNHPSWGPRGGDGPDGQKPDDDREGK
jgi:LTXXQ motif family protein